MTIGTGIRIASATLSLAIFSTLSASAALSSAPQASDQLAEAVVEEKAALIEIVAPKDDESLGTIRFETGGESRRAGLPFGGPR